MSLILVYVTNKNLSQAKELVNHLLKKKLIACANIFPIQSIYSWKNKIENSKEIVSLLKIKKENWNKLKKEIKKIHPYELPCIIKLNASANKDFNSWINQETK
jgi:periplasmic divalent cation tolerance protein